MGSFAVAVGVVVPIIPHISVGEKYLRIYSKIFAIKSGNHLRSDEETTQKIRKY